MTAQVWFLGENGLLNVFDEPLPESIAHRLATGDLTRVNPDGSPWDPGEAEPEPADEVPPDAPPLPKRADSRAVWQEFAASQGMDAAEVATATKADLVAKFTAPQ